MEILETSQSYFNKIKKIIKVDSSVHISTFNIYAGVLDDGRYVNDWGGKFQNQVGKLFDYMDLRNCKVHIKVGKPRPSKCPLRGINIKTEALEKFVSTNTIINFGKYKNTNIQDVTDWDYIEWMAKQDSVIQDGVNYTTLARAELLRRGDKPPTAHPDYPKEAGCSASTRDSKWDNRIKHTVEKWSRFNFEVIDESHVKLILVSPNHFVVGGRNLSDSNDKDLSFYSADNKLYGELLRLFNELG